MATGMHMDERSVDCLVLGHHDQDRKVSAKSVTMRAMTLCKNLSGYRELLLKASVRVSDVARYNCHPSTIQRLRDRYQATGIVKDRRRFDQPRMATGVKRQLRLIVY